MKTPKALPRSAAEVWSRVAVKLIHAARRRGMDEFVRSHGARIKGRVLNALNATYTPISGVSYYPHEAWVRDYRDLADELAEDQARRAGCRMEEHPSDQNKWGVSGTQYLVFGPDGKLLVRRSYRHEAWTEAWRIVFDKTEGPSMYTAHWPEVPSRYLVPKPAEAAPMRKGRRR